MIQEAYNLLHFSINLHSQQHGQKNPLLASMHKCSLLNICNGYVHSSISITNKFYRK